MEISLQRLPLLLLAVFLSACTVTFSPEGGAVAAVSVVSTEALPPYPGATELERREDRDKTTLRLATYDSAAAVFAFYDRELRARGWRLEDDDRDRGRDEIEAEYERGDAEVRLKVQRKRDHVRVELEYDDRGRDDRGRDDDHDDD